MTGTTQPRRSLTGRAWVFGDNIDTDAMYPGFAMKLPIRGGQTRLLRPPPRLD
jgi:3-isopropylmalate dehydratase small subunit